MKTYKSLILLAGVAGIFALGCSGEKSEEKLGMDDPVYDRLRSAMAGLLNAYQHIDDYIEKGKVIEEFVAETGSSHGQDILNNFADAIGKFWLVKPKAASLESLLEDLQRAA